MDPFDAVRSEWWERAEDSATFVLAPNGIPTAINCLLLFLCVVQDGPLVNETVAEFNARLDRYFKLFLDEQDVVGRLQEGSEPGNDPGDDEDRPGGENQRPGLRGRGEV